jgi:predicted transcriptional regulator
MLHATGVAGDSQVIEKLPPRERQVFDALYARGEATAAELCESMEDPPSNSAVRIMLSRLEKKGFVAHRRDGQAYIYAPAVADRRIRQSAVRHFIRTFFGGSPAGAAAALIGMSKHIDPAELEQLEQAIAKARKEQGQ